MAEQMTTATPNKRDTRMIQSGVNIVKVPGKAVSNFIIANHYSKKVAPISYAWAMQNKNGDIIGAVTFGQSASPYVSISIRGRDSAIPVLELNRLAIASNDKNAASKLIGYALRHLPKNMLIVSYADTGFGHIGYVYQATNWHYSGITKKRTDIYSPSGHARHHGGDVSVRQDRTPKHRYWIATGKNANRASLWPSLPYPKGETVRHYSEKIIKEGSLI
jgi:hypothetical protein